MDWGLFGTLLAAIYPPMKDAILYVSTKGPSANSPYKEQVSKMIALTQEDLSRLKTEIDELRKVCAEINLNTSARGGVPWHIPHDVNAYLTWRYRRVSRKVEDLGNEFQASLDGIIDVISCCAGIMGRSTQENLTPNNADAALVGNLQKLAKELDRQHEDLREKARFPSQHSIDDLTNAMESFLDTSRRAMQNLVQYP